jgi:hypothetical protein
MIWRILIGALVGAVVAPTLVLSLFLAFVWGPERAGERVPSLWIQISVLAGAMGLLAGALIAAFQ